MLDPQIPSSQQATGFYNKSTLVIKLPIILCRIIE